MNFVQFIELDIIIYMIIIIYLIFRAAGRLDWAPSPFLRVIDSFVQLAILILLVLPLI